MEVSNPVAVQKAPWNKGKLVGQKLPLRLKEIWAIRIRLQLATGWGLHPLESAAFSRRTP